MSEYRTGQCAEKSFFFLTTKETFENILQSIIL